MSAVSSTALLWCSVDLNVCDVEGFWVQVLDLSVAFGVLKEAEKMFSTLLGPSSLGDTEDRDLRCTSNTSVESSEGNGTLVCDDIFQVSLSLSQGKSLKSVGALTGVLEVNPEVRSLGLSALSGILDVSGISSLHHVVAKEGVDRKSVV